LDDTRKPSGRDHRLSMLAGGWNRHRQLARSPIQRAVQADSETPHARWLGHAAYSSRCAGGAGGYPGVWQDRELGKHPRPARYGLMLQLGGHGHEPWLSVEDRWRPMLRARWGAAGEDDAARSPAVMVASWGDG
jgi:hypothetical protein